MSGKEVLSGDSKGKYIHPTEWSRFEKLLSAFLKS